MIRASTSTTEVGLRYRRGRYERLLEPGGHWLLGLIEQRTEHGCRLSELVSRPTRLS